MMTVIMFWCCHTVQYYLCHITGLCTYVIYVPWPTFIHRPNWLPVCDKKAALAYVVCFGSPVHSNRPILYAFYLLYTQIGNISLYFMRCVSCTLKWVNPISVI